MQLFVRSQLTHTLDVKGTETVDDVKVRNNSTTLITLAFSFHSSFEKASLSTFLWGTFDGVFCHSVLKTVLRLDSYFFSQFVGLTETSD